MTLCGVNMSYSKKGQLIQRSQNSSKRRQLFCKLLLFININIGRLLKAGGRPTLELLWGCLTSLSLHFVLQPDEIWVIAPHDGLHTCACTNTKQTVAVRVIILQEVKDTASAECCSVEAVPLCVNPVCYTSSYTAC